MLALRLIRFSDARLHPPDHLPAMHISGYIDPPNVRNFVTIYGKSSGDAFVLECPLRAGQIMPPNGPKWPGTSRNERCPTATAVVRRLEFNT